jgi:hypothetical protein
MSALIPVSAIVMAGLVLVVLLWQIFEVAKARARAEPTRALDARLEDVHTRLRRLEDRLDGSGVGEDR